MVGLFLPIVCAFILDGSKPKSVFPQSCNWEKITAYQDSQLVFFDAEQEFVNSFKLGKLTLVRQHDEKTFDCPVEAAFWVFDQELNTGSHYGNTDIKNQYKSLIKQYYGF